MYELVAVTVVIRVCNPETFRRKKSNPIQFLWEIPHGFHHPVGLPIPTRDLLVKDLSPLTFMEFSIFCSEFPVILRGMKKSSSIPRILGNVNFSGIAKKSLEIANPITDLRYSDSVYKCSYLGSVRLAVCQCGVNAHFVEYIGWKSLCGANVCISSSLLLIFNISFVFIYCSIAVRY